MFFILIAGPTMVLYGFVLLSIGALRLVSVFSFGLQNLPKKINIVTSLVTISMAVIILYFQVIIPTSQWLHYFLYWIVKLWYRSCRLRIANTKLNLILRAIIILTGFIVVALNYCNSFSDASYQPGQSANLSHV